MLAQLPQRHPKSYVERQANKGGGGVLDGLRRRGPGARVRLRNPEGSAGGVCRNCGRGHRARHLLRLPHGLVRQPADAFYEAADGVSCLVDAGGDAGVALQGLRVQGTGCGRGHGGAEREPGLLAVAVCVV